MTDTPATPAINSGIFAPLNQNAATAPLSKPTAEPIPMETSQAPADSANKETELEVEKAEDIKLPSELEMLRARASKMGLNPGNAGLEVLKAKIAEKMGTDVKEQVEAAPIVDASTQINPFEAAPLGNPVAEMIEASVQGEAAAPAPAPIRRRTLRQKMRDEQMKLVRVRITNMDPKKADLNGEIFTVANEYLGTVKQFVPYGEATENGWHLPYCLYKQLEERRFLSITTKKDQRTGIPVKQERWMKEFGLEILPPLTKEELQRLGTAQIAAGTVSVGGEDQF